MFQPRLPAHTSTTPSIVSVPPLALHLPPSLLLLLLHGGALLGEPLREAPRGGEVLGHAPLQAARLAAGEGLAGEVVDAGDEAAVYHRVEHLCLLARF